MLCAVETSTSSVALKVIKGRFHLGQYSEAVVCEEATCSLFNRGRTWNAKITFHSGRSGMVGAVFRELGPLEGVAHQESCRRPCGAGEEIGGCQGKS